MALTKIKTGGITDNAITNAKMADNAIDSADYADGSIDNVHLAGSIAVSKTLLSAGAGLTLSTNSLSVDADQSGQITSVGTLGSLSVRTDQNSETSISIQNANTGTAGHAELLLKNSNGNVGGLRAHSSGFTTSNSSEADGFTIESYRQILHLVASNDKDIKFWNGTSNNVTFKNGGNVGIGITSPQSHNVTNAVHIGSDYELGFGDGANSRPDFGIAATGSGGSAKLNIYCGEGSDDIDLHIDTNGAVAFADGSEGAPAITNIGDTNTGWYFGAADEMNLSLGGAHVWRWSGRQWGAAHASHTAAGYPAYSFAADWNTGMYHTGVADNLFFATGGTERLNINDGGLVTVHGAVSMGATNAADQLYVGSGAFPSARINNMAGGEGGIRMRSYEDGSNQVHADLLVQETGGNETGYFAIRMPYTTERMRITSAGAVTFAGTGQFSGQVTGQMESGNDRGYSRLSVGNGWSMVELGEVSGSYWGMGPHSPGSYGLTSECQFAYYNSSSWTAGIFKIATGGNITGTHGSYHTSSDETLKKNISTISSGLDKVNAMRGVQFKWKKEHDPFPEEEHPNHQRVNLGFIAQELEDIVPEVVNTNSDTGLRSVLDANQLTAVLVEAIKELSAKVTALENA